MAPLPALTKKRHTLADVPEESLAFALFHRELQRETAAPLESFADEDLGKWEKKAIKAVKARKSANVPFESDSIPADLQYELAEVLNHCIDSAHVKATFAALKSQTLTPDEQIFADALMSSMGKIERTIIAAILAQRSIALPALVALLTPAILSNITNAGLRVLDNLAEDIGLDLDDALALGQMTQWAADYTAELVNGITTSTQPLVEQAIAVYRSTPDMTRADLESILRRAFGQRRAETIAVTEVTRAASHATRQYQAYLADAGLGFVRVNHTNADDKVCAVCGPLDGKAEADWPSPDGPPWHPRCRCIVTLERIDD